MVNFKRTTLNLGLSKQLEFCSPLQHEAFKTDPTHILRGGNSASLCSNYNVPGGERNNYDSQRAPTPPRNKTPLKDFYHDGNIERCIDQGGRPALENNYVACKSPEGLNTSGGSAAEKLRKCKVVSRSGCLLLSLG